MPVLWRLPAALALVAAVITPAAAEPGPAELLEDIRSTRPDVEAMVSLRQVEIALGSTRFEIERGVLVPAKARSGKILEWIFVGQARVRLEPPDDIEAGQLELFTGERSLEAPVEEAVLVLANPAPLEALLARPAPHELRPELARRVLGLYDQWLRGAERRRSGVEANIFNALAGDRVFADYFAVWCRSFELGDFVLQLDPEDVEPITLASFRPAEVQGWQRARLRHQIRVQQRKDRWLNLRLEDLGSWDVWLSTAWAPPAGPALPGNVGFETEHYEIDVKLKKDRLWLDGRAKLDLDVQASGRRVVRLELFGDLRVRQITDGRGRELFFFRSGDEVVVHLPEASRAGERMTLDVAYDGRALHWVRPGVFDLEETDSWYPHCGTVDRATYDVTLRWPKGLQLVAGGRFIAAGRTGDFRWERRALDIPSIAFSFMVGDFLIERQRVGHVDVSLAFAHDAKHKPTRELREQALATVADALGYFERTFGPYPLAELVVVTVPRPYSQSYLGFITLAESVFRQPDPLGLSSRWQRSTTIAHELAHQWWGNLVGWWSYRDQWLSEGMANYSALLYNAQQSAGEPNRLALMSAGWRDSLSVPTSGGRTIESLGPIVLGNRLNSSRASDAYRTIVYRKGAVVLAMLARAVGEERFIPMLHALAGGESGQVMTTESFLDSVERMSGMDLDDFAQQFVYGTGIPEVFYAYDSQPAEDGGWTLEGEARLLAAPRYGHKIVHTADGRLDVERTTDPKPGTRPSTLVVPYHVSGDERSSDDPAATARGGQLFLEGHRAEFRIETDFEPIDLRFDPRGEILAWFYSEQHDPKRVLRYEAEELAIEKRWDEAEARYGEALRVPQEEAGRVDPLGPPPRDPRIDGRLEDLRIRLSLVRLHLQRDRLADAAAELGAFEDALPSDERSLLRMEREVLWARLDMRRGDSSAALRRLKRTLRSAAAPPRGQQDWRDLPLQSQLQSERLALTEAYALLAVAAHELGATADLAWALGEARERGADVSLLAHSAD